MCYLLGEETLALATQSLLQAQNTAQELDKKDEAEVEKYLLAQKLPLHLPCSWTLPCADCALLHRESPRHASMGITKQK